MDVSVVVLPDLAPAAWLDAVRAAEAAGVRTVWTYDHLSWRDMRDGPWYGAVPLLSAAAVACSRVRLGTFVASPNFRHPVPFAKEVMTLDTLSGGRFELGIGSGGTGADATVLGPVDGPRPNGSRNGAPCSSDVCGRRGSRSRAGGSPLTMRARSLGRPGCR